jgi:hypothetical protein
MISGPTVKHMHPVYLGPCYTLCSARRPGEDGSWDTNIGDLNTSKDEILFLIFFNGLICRMYFS